MAVGGLDLSAVLQAGKAGARTGGGEAVGFRRGAGSVGAGPVLAEAARFNGVAADPDRLVAHRHLHGVRRKRAVRAGVHAGAALAAVADPAAGEGGVVIERGIRDQHAERLAYAELVLAVGGAAIRWHLGARDVTATVRDWRHWLGAQGVLPLPHPSWRNTGWLKRNPWFEADLVPDLRARVRRLMDE